MASMMSSDRNRCKNKVDNPMDDDGFWMHRRFKGNRKGGSPTGKRAWRRVIRAKESVEWKREVAA